MSAIIATLCGNTITPRKLNPATWFSQTWPLSTLYRPKFDILVASGAELQVLLSKGHLTSVQIVEECLKQIQNNDDYLSAVITLAPGIKTLALKRDQERRGDSTEGPLYGLPVLIKDNIDTGPDLDMNTTAGSLALANSQSFHSAPVVDALLRAGMMVIAKAQLSELAMYKGSGLPSGWSAIRGQCQSAYTTDDVQSDDGMLGYSSPGGSSTGSAVGVSAGYAPISIGTDTTGSVIVPATRAALYAIRVTPGNVLMDGIVPLSRTLDTVGVMAKSSIDIANVLDVIMINVQPRLKHFGHRSNLVKGWGELKVGVVAPEYWKWDADLAKPNEEVEQQLIDDTRAAYNKIKPLAKSFKEVKLISWTKIEGEDGGPVIWNMLKADFENDLNLYLKGLKSSEVRSLKELIAWNKQHASKEVPDGYTQQDLLEGAAAYNLSQTERDDLLKKIRSVCREQGIDKTFEKHDLDVIMGPADSAFNLLVAGGGYPSATMPLSTLKFNNRPFGLFAIARRNDEKMLIRAMSAWENTFPPRRIPPLSSKSKNQ